MNKIRVGMFVIYNGTVFVVDSIEGDGMWCSDEQGGEAFLRKSEVDVI